MLHFSEASFLTFDDPVITAVIYVIVTLPKLYVASYDCNAQFWHNIKQHCYCCHCPCKYFTKQLQWNISYSDHCSGSSTTESVAIPPYLPVNHGNDDDNDNYDNHGYNPCLFHVVVAHDCFAFIYC